MSHARRSSLPVRIGLVAILGFCGLLFATSAASSHGHDLRPAGSTDLADLVRSQSRTTEEQTARANELREEIDELTAAGSADPALESDVDALAMRTGLVEMTGPGLTVELDDAPIPVDGPPPGIGVDAYVIHQQDVEGVMNALWRGGAEAMSVQGQRIVPTSAIRCVGNVIIVNGQVFSPPYTVTAIGDPARLGRALTEEPAVQTFRDAVDALGLRYDVTRERSTTVPAYEGSTDLSYVQEPAA